MLSRIAIDIKDLLQKSCCSCVYAISQIFDVLHASDLRPYTNFCGLLCMYFCFSKFTTFNLHVDDISCRLLQIRMNIFVILLAYLSGAFGICFVVCQPARHFCCYEQFDHILLAPNRFNTTQVNTNDVKYLSKMIQRNIDDTNDT